MAKRYNRTSAIIASDDIDDLSERSNPYSSIKCDTYGLLRGETARNDGWLLFGGFNRALLF